MLVEVLDMDERGENVLAELVVDQDLKASQEKENEDEDEDEGEDDSGVVVSGKENGTLEEYKLGPEGVNQTLLAGELFEMVSVPTNTCCVSPRPTQLSQVNISKK
ncbi:hypothetical protein CsSME_00034686 [Camellia sinensis var. sinensis]